MKVSTKGRYALRMLVDLCEHECEGYIPLKEVADRQEISKKYLEQIIPLFNSTDILISARGNQGGYRLGRLPKDVSVGEVLTIAEGSISPVSCVDEEMDCERLKNCPTRKVWQNLDTVIKDYLYHVSLQDILNDKTK
ncbi:RrF2 family transcriptional regulator [Gallicola sp. Sow4_E12]|uniref:RrF2 family transcriptional regulator n=1 Tax=Gallicola sp. Sow4_E12 TaxID=3438785 RepID=UPI003F8DF19C